MTGTETNFKEFQSNLFSKWQKIILKITWIVAAVILVVELFNYIMLLINHEEPSPELFYLFVRVVCPSLLNFSTLIVVTIFHKSDKFNSYQKNMHASFAIFMICSVMAIFHNYYQILLCTSVIPFFICGIFGDKGILRYLLFLSIPVFIATVLTFFFDKETGDYFYKGVITVCDFVLVFSSYIFASAIVKSQEKQFEYIHNSYRNQTKLIEELKIEPLTKLYNRTALDDAMARIIRRYNFETIRPFLVIMDIDNFKKINDVYGHTCGDEVLIKLSDIIKEKMASSRKSFRYGGEEFILVFENSMPSNVIYVVEEIREEFSKSNFDFAPGRSFTISAGISTMNDRFDAKAWVNNADKALYYAKEHGKNQIKVADVD